MCGGGACLMNLQLALLTSLAVALADSSDVTFKFGELALVSCLSGNGCMPAVEAAGSPRPSRRSASHACVTAAAALPSGLPLSRQQRIQKMQHNLITQMPRSSSFTLSRGSMSRTFQTTPSASGARSSPVAADACLLYRM